MEDVIENWTQYNCDVGQHCFCGKEGEKKAWLMSYYRGDVEIGVFVSNPSSLHLI